MIDAHVHVWTHAPEYPWAAEETNIPQYTAYPDDLLDLMQKNGVGQAVLVQYIKYRWDNRYVARMIEAHPSLFMGVCRVNPQDPESPDHLSYWTEKYGFRGVRLSPSQGAQGDWFTGPLMQPLFKRAVDLQVPVILLISPARLLNLGAILEKVPQVSVIIDHLADCIHPEKDDLKTLLAFARYPNVFLKIGHIPQNSTQRYPWKDTHQNLERVFQQFGPQRMMWGSDWPMCLPSNTYAQSIGFLQNELTFLTQEDREWIFRKTALQFWPFPGD